MPRTLALALSDLTEVSPGVYRKRHMPHNGPNTDDAHDRPEVAPRGSQTPSGGTVKEKVLQADVEQWLVGRGYRRMTPEAYAAAKAGLPTRGFYFHMRDSRRECTLPDLLLIAYPNTRPPLLLELKRGEKAAWQRGQKDAVLLKIWRVAFGFGEACGVVEKWEVAT